MSKECAICGKKVVSANQISHSHRVSKRTMGANLQKKNVEVDGKKTKKYICTKCLKTLKKDQ